MKDMSNTKKISIIIPVYNAEKYIRRCIESITSQDYPNLQIVVVNDGSIDNTLSVLQNLQDERIQVFSIKNAGVSNARNFGLSKATGEYVMFADGDDWLNPNVLGTLVSEEQKNNYDLIIGNYSRNKQSAAVKNKVISFTELTKDDAYFQVINPDGFWGSVWSKLFRLDIIKENKLEFNTDITIGEDLLFVYQYINNVERIAYTDAELYNYYINKESALHTLNKDNLDRRLDILKVYEAIFKQKNIQQQNYYERAVAIYVRELTEWYCYAIHFNRNDLTKSLESKIQKYWTIFTHDKTFSLKNKISAFLKWQFPTLAYKLRK